MEQKIQGMEDFRLSCDFAKSLNHTLQEKMMEVNEERAAALFTRKKCEEIVEDLKDIVGEDNNIQDSKVKKQDNLEKSILDEEISQMEISVVLGFFFFLYYYSKDS